MKVSWLLLLYQIPAKADADRVRIWRKLQKMGAVTVKNSVSAVPDTAYFKRKTIEVAEEILSTGGEAIITKGEFIFGISAESLIQSYNAQIDVEYKSLAHDIRNAIKEMPKKNSNSELMKLEHKRTKFIAQIKDLSDRLISLVDGHELCQNQILDFDKRLKRSTLAQKQQKQIAKVPLGSTWVTRKDLYIDRLESAWLIQKYIDSKAKFLFVDMDKYQHKAHHYRFDVYGGEFTHNNDLCTFEVLVNNFKIRNPAVKTLAEVIHDLDIEDQKFDRAETAGIRMALDGLVRAYPKDEDRLNMAIKLFDSLILSLK